MSKQLRWKENEWFNVVEGIGLAWTGPVCAPECNWAWYAAIRAGGKRMRRITGRMPAGMRARGDKTGGRRKGQALMKRPKIPTARMKLGTGIKRLQAAGIIRQVPDLSEDTLIL